MTRWPAVRFLISPRGPTLNVKAAEIASITRSAALPRPGQPGVLIKPWDPQTPYLAALKQAAPAARSSCSTRSS
jgi:hypothetical protein